MADLVPVIRSTFFSRLAALALAVFAADGLHTACSDEGTAELIESGKKLYLEKDYERALERFTAARDAEPDNPDAILLVGLAHVRLNEPREAADEWKRFLEISTDPKLDVEIGRYTTILLQEASAREAREALQREERLGTAATDPKTVAVGAFRNVGTPEYDPLGKALTAMLIDNLSAVPEIRVLEREQVQALVDEAGLTEKGLADESTAVRAGKLLRAGQVTGGSHLDRDAKELRVDAVLVNADSGKELSKATEEAPIAEFSRIVPKLAVGFVPAMTKESVAALPPARAERVRNPHTESLPAVLAFGRVLDAKDRKDADTALDECKTIEKEDPNFELAMRTCAFIPPVWVSSEAIVVSVEPYVFPATQTSLLGSPLVRGGAAAAVAAGLAAGIYYGAVDDGGDGGGGGGPGPGAPGGPNQAPAVGGVSDGTVAANDTIVRNVSASDPNPGQIVSLTARNLPSNSRFDATPGNPATGQFRFTPDANQAGRTFVVTFTATDNGTPPAVSSEQSARFRVEAVEAQPTPRSCDPLGTSCDASSQCCSGQCAQADAGGPNVCCAPEGSSCSASSECCFTNCTSGRCCNRPGFAGQGGGAFCQTDAGCCDGAICGSGTCCFQDGRSCSVDDECCSLNCVNGTCAPEGCFPAGTRCTVDQQCCSVSCDPEQGVCR